MHANAVGDFGTGHGAQMAHTQTQKILLIVNQVFADATDRFAALAHVGQKHLCTSDILLQMVAFF